MQELFSPEAGGQLKWNFYAAVKAKGQISFTSTEINGEGGIELFVCYLHD